MTVKEDILNKSLDETKKQVSFYMNEAQKYKNLYQDSLEENELLNREKDALIDYNEMKCDEIDRLKRKIKGMEQTILNLKKKIDAYYRAMTKN